MRNNALLIVPHQDDETNLAGNIIDVIQERYDLYILYSSLDTDSEKGEIRKQEAINACAVWSIQQDHLIFLGYPDTSNKEGHHWFTEGNHRIIEDLKKQILYLQPEIIYATDFDYHSDHRMLSIAFEMAMGQLLKETTDYHPIVFKGFCYETAYYGEKDYKASCPGKSTSNMNPLSNPSYEWEKRVSIDSNEKPGFIWKRKAYRALAAHKSQCAILHARSIVNADNVFWLRRTDNLLYTAKLSGSVDDIEKLRDFLILDTNDLITKDPRKIDYNKAVCKFDTNSWVKAEWAMPVDISKIVLHGSINQIKKLGNAIDVRIIADTEQVGEIRELKEYGRDTEILLQNIKTKELKIVFESVIELSEIEVLWEGNEDVLFEHIPYMNIKNTMLDIVDKIGYKGIVLLTKIKRKIKNTIIKTEIK